MKNALKLGLAVVALAACLSCKTTESASSVKDVISDDFEEGAFVKLPFTNACKSADPSANRPQCVDLQREVYFGRELGGKFYYFVVGNILRFDDSANLQFKNVPVPPAGQSSPYLFRFHIESDSIMVMALPPKAGQRGEGVAQVNLIDPQTKIRVGRASLNFSFKERAAGELPDSMDSLLDLMVMDREGKANGPDQIRIDKLTLNELCSGVYVNNCVLTKNAAYVKVSDTTISDVKASKTQVDFRLKVVKPALALDAKASCVGYNAKMETTGWSLNCAQEGDSIKVTGYLIDPSATPASLSYMVIGNAALSLKTHWDSIIGSVKKDPVIKKVTVSAHNKEALAIVVEHDPIDAGTEPVQSVDVALEGLTFISGYEPLESTPTQTSFRAMFPQDFPFYKALSVKINRSKDWPASIVDNQIFDLYRAEKLDFQKDGGKLKAVLTVKPDISRVKYAMFKLSCNDGKVIKEAYGYDHENDAKSDQFKFYDLALTADEEKDLKACVVKDLHVTDSSTARLQNLEKRLVGKIGNLP